MEESKEGISFGGKIAPEMTTITVRLPSTLKFEFEEAADYNNRTASQQIRQNMKEFINFMQEAGAHVRHGKPYEDEPTKLDAQFEAKGFDYTKPGRFKKKGGKK